MLFASILSDTCLLLYLQGIPANVASLQLEKTFAKEKQFILCQHCCISISFANTYANISTKWHVFFSAQIYSIPVDFHHDAMTFF